MSNGIVVSRGWSSDYAKRKFGIELDMADLIKILAEARFPDPEHTAAAMTIGDVFDVLDNQAMMFVHYTLSKMEPAEAKTHLQRVMEATRERNAIMAKYPGYASAQKPEPAVA